MALSAIICYWKIFRPKYIFQKISHSIFLIFVLIFNGMCSQGKSSLWQMFYKIAVLKNFAIFSEKHHRKTPGVSFLINCRSEAFNFIKKRLLQYRCFPVNLAKFSRTPFFTEHLLWLILPVIKCATDVQELNISE